MIRLFSILSILVILCGCKNSDGSNSNGDDSSNSAINAGDGGETVGFTTTIEIQVIVVGSATATLPDTLFPEGVDGEFEFIVPPNQVDFGTTVTEYAGRVSDSSEMNGSYLIEIRVPQSDIPNIEQLIIVLYEQDVNGNVINTFEMDSSRFDFSEDGDSYVLEFAISYPNFRFQVVQPNGSEIPEEIVTLPPPNIGKAQIGSISSDAATVTWSDVPGVETYVICYYLGTSLSDTQCNNADFSVDVDAGIGSYDVSGLDPESSYTVVVASKIGTDISNGTAASFSTTASLGPRWSNISNVNAPNYRQWSKGAFTGNYFVIWGGREQPSNTLVNTGAIYNPATDTWTTMSTSGALSVRYSHAVAAIDNDRVFYWGGSPPPAPFNLTDGAIFNAATNTWSTINTTGAPNGVGPGRVSAVWDQNDRVYVFSHTTEDNTPQVMHYYTISTDSWATTSAGCDFFLYDTMVWLGDKVAIIGGEDYDANPLGNLCVYTPGTNTWAIDLVPNRPCMDWTSPVWTGSKLVLLGGQVDVATPDVCSTGGVYDPPTRAWTATTLTNTIDERSGHTANWYGSEVYVWGGHDNDPGSWYMDGKAYNPATDSWRDLIDLPDERTNSYSFIYNNKIYIWGGNNGTGPIHTGIIYSE